MVRIGLGLDSVTAGLEKSDTLKKNPKVCITGGVLKKWGHGTLTGIELETWLSIHASAGLQVPGLDEASL